jgi:glycerol transport system ATP-binding protein
MNLLPCRLDGDAIAIDGVRLPLTAEKAQRARAAGGELQLGIRPEFLRCLAAPQPGAIAADIEAVEDLGNYKIVTARLSGQVMKAKLPEDETVALGQGWLLLPAARTRLYASGRAID